VGFAALGIGLAVGGGVYLASGVRAVSMGSMGSTGSTGRSNVVAGLVSALIAAVSIAGGRVGAMVCSGQGDLLASEGGLVETEFAISFVADGIIAEREARGETIEWPAESVPDFAAREADYPADAWGEAVERWLSLSKEERCRINNELPGSRTTRLDSLRCLFADGGLTDLKLLDAAFALLALGAAFKLGSMA
jgi:hypothetical protein